MANKISLVLKLVKIGLSDPISFLKKVNIKNIKTLRMALRYENPKEIEQNFKVLVKSPSNDTKKKGSKSLNLDNIVSNEVKYLKRHTFKLREIEYTNFGDTAVSLQAQTTQKHIVIIADLNLPQCKKYRILQKVEIFKRLNYKCSFTHWEDIPRCLNFIQTATSVLFYRIPDTKVTSCYLDEAFRLKISTGYDIDDPIFDSDIYSKNKNLDAIAPHEKENLLRNTAIYRSFMKKCDFIITSTPGMVKAIKKHTKKHIFLWRNLIDSETLNALKYSNEVYFPSKKTKKDFVISYMSGSRAHEADFMEAMESIRKILTTLDFVKLNITGYAEYGKELKAEFPDKVRLLPFSDYYTYLSKYQDVDLNIIPLVCDEFNDCKSAIRMMEAALFNVPTMVSKIGDFLNIIEDKNNGILIENSADWYQEILHYIKNRSSLREIGKNANKSVEHSLSIPSFCNVFSKDLAAYL